MAPCEWRYAAVVAATLVLASCGGTTSRDNVDRSIRELHLAGSLREEGRTAGAIEHLRKAIELDDNNSEAHLLLGFIQMERRAFANAEQHILTGIEKLQEQGRQGAALAEARNMHGLCLLELGRHDEAIDVLKLSANDELNAAPHLAWGNLGLAYLDKKSYAQAVEATAEATRIQPRFCIGYYTMGRALFAMGDLQKAEQALVRSLDADEQCQDSPLLQGAWQLRGEVRARLGHRQDAVADLERCVELGPNTKHGELCQKILQDGR